MNEQIILNRAWEYVSQEKDPLFRNEVERLLNQNNLEELEERFYTGLNFGTGGIRGIMGGGFNRMNPLVIQRTTQGLANYIVKQTKEPPSVAIAYDSRINSPLFAQTAAQVLAANGIHVYLFSSLRPTPELSFAVRQLNCISGIVCTASHNPKKYNGYKVYWQDGAQIVFPQDEGIIKEVNAVKEDIKSLEIEEALSNGLIKYIDEEIDRSFTNMVIAKVLRPSVFSNFAGKRPISIVYTPLHGTGANLIERICKKLDLSITIVPEQCEPDGNFPTVEFPNPEEPTAMKMAVDLAKRKNADIVIGTDPDADRIGVAVRHGDEHLLLSGNQHGVLLCDYMLGSMKELNILPPRPAFINTIVSTDLQRKVAHKYGAEVYETLTGFKWIAAKIREFEQCNGPQYVLGGEESYGFMIGTDVRDKDAISAALITIEMTAYYLQQGKSIIDRLYEIYSEFGLYQDGLISKSFEGLSGIDTMRSIMSNLRDNPPEKIAGIEVVQIRDILNGTSLNTTTNTVLQNLELPSSNVLQFFLADGSTISARPSGTEPKIKFYTSVKSEAGEDLSKAKKAVQDKINAIENYIELVIAAAK